MNNKNINRPSCTKLRGYNQFENVDRKRSFREYEGGLMWIEIILLFCEYESGMMWIEIILQVPYFFTDRKIQPTIPLLKNVQLSPGMYYLQSHFTGFNFFLIAIISAIDGEYQGFWLLCRVGRFYDRQKTLKETTIRLLG